MHPWRYLADRCVPAAALRWTFLDGYLPPAPDGYRWVHRSTHLRIVDRGNDDGQWPTGRWELRRAPRPRLHTQRTM